MPRTSRRAVLAALAAAPLMRADSSEAQVFPSRPVRIVIPFGPGGGTDNLIRTIEQQVAQRLSQPLVIENRPGAASTIGTDQVARAEPDGHTVLAVDSSFNINPALLPSLPYDSVRGFAPVSLLASGPVILVVHPSVQARTLQEFITLAKSSPGRIGYASGGNGSGPHLAGELLKMEAGIDLQHIPYRGTGAAMADLLGGHVLAAFNGVSATKTAIESGQLRPLAVTGNARSPTLPDVPTFAEAGLPGVDASSYWGVLAPAGVPPARLQILSRAFAEAVKVPELQPRLQQMGFVTMGTDGPAYGRLIAAEMAKWERVIRAGNIKPD